MEEVSTWQNKLSIADSVITVWFEVQRTWLHLESIFMSSEDIRKQLPEDSDRFDVIDTDFKVNSPDSRLNIMIIIIAAINERNGSRIKRYSIHK